MEKDFNKKVDEKQKQLDEERRSAADLQNKSTTSTNTDLQMKQYREQIKKLKDEIKNLQKGLTEEKTARKSLLEQSQQSIRSSDVSFETTKVEQVQKDLEQLKQERDKQVDQLKKDLELQK